MADPLRPTDPRQIGRYRILRRIGEGGMGSVFLAEDPAGRPVAVKIIRAEYAHEEQYRARFRSEVSRAREVPPFCTAEVLDADPDHETPYLVVEYVDGPSLSEVVADQGPLTGGSLHGVAVGVAAALAAIHGAGVIHRDLKPRNVLFALGTPKVIDFGIARPLEPTSFHTRAEEMVGTLAYMAPERLDPQTDRLLTPAADVFAWGAVVTYAGTGRTPFGGDSPAVTAARILTQPPRIGDLPPYLAELVIAALDKEPENRPTAPELLDRLLVSGAPSAPPLPAGLRRDAEAAQHAGPLQPRRRTEQSRTSGTGERAKRARRSRRVAVLAAATVVAVAVAGATIGAGLRQRDEPRAPEPAAAARPPVTGPAIFDSLRKDSLFSAVKDDNGECGYRRGLRVTARAGRSMLCGPYPRTVFASSQNVSVTATLNSDRSCAGIWFRASPEEPEDAFADAYRVTVCPAEVTLISTRDGDENVVATVDRNSPVGAAQRIQVVADERDSVVSIDGNAVLEGVLTESSLLSGRVLIGAVNPSGGRADVTFTDAQLRSGADPAVPPLPAFTSGDAQFTAGVHMLYDLGRVSILEPAEFLTGEEYCRRFAQAQGSPKCADRFVPVASGVQVTVPIAAEPVYLDYRRDRAKCVDRQTLGGTCRVSFDEFATTDGETSPWPALVTIRRGEVTTVAKMDLG
ncbi:serine/threonine-protein kinase [Actinoplanes sp. NPDC051861]|uniref:serine/threonine-protein kinase n=1 Tax=Actinoplanes sp. NPDC051861 TaxID=3155170 RepID=UPI0034186A4C